MPALSEQSANLFTLPFMRRLNSLFGSYDLFFQVLRAGKYQDFTSPLEADLKRE